MPQAVPTDPADAAPAVAPATTALLAVLRLLLLLTFIPPIQRNLQAHLNPPFRDKKFPAPQRGMQLPNDNRKRRGVGTAEKLGVSDGVRGPKTLGPGRHGEERELQGAGGDVQGCVRHNTR